MDLFTIAPVAGFREHFAECYVADSVQIDPRDQRCSECLTPLHRRRLEGYTIAWQPGSEVVPDFVDFGANVVVAECVKDAFEAAGLRGYVAWPVKIKERTTPKRRHRWPIVASPYAGPPLWDIYTEAVVRIVPEPSSLKYKGRCSKCGQEMYGVLGEVGEQYFLVDRASWKGEDFLLGDKLTGLIVTERVIDVIKAHEFTNVRYWRIGEIGG